MIDFQGDLLAYPILYDSYNQNKNVLQLGIKDLQENGNN